MMKTFALTTAAAAILALAPLSVPAFAEDAAKTHDEATPTPDAKPTSTETGTSPAGTAAEGTAKEGKPHSDHDVKMPPTPSEAGTSPNGTAAENDGAAETPPAGETSGEPSKAP